MTPEDTERRHGRAAAIFLAALIVVGLGLRFFRLGDWGFEGDEVFTLRDSLHPRLGNPRPLLYLLNYALVRPLVPLDEFGLRLLPAAFGVLAIPVVYFVGRSLVGSRAGLFAALLLAFSALHVYHSQYARYWSLVFLLSAVYPYAIYLGVRERSPRALVVGLLTGVLAVLAHPVSVLLVGGLVLWATMTYLRRDVVARLWSQRTVRWATVLIAVLAVAVAVRYILILRGWIAAHDGPRLQRGDHLLHLPAGRGVKQIAYLLSLVEGLTVPLALTGVLGIYLLWRGRDRVLALLMTCLLFFPVAFLVLLSFRTAVSTSYLMPAIPVFFFGAGVLLDRLAVLDWELRPRWLLSAAVTIIIVHSAAPTLVSQYRDGRRHDFRSVARWLEAHFAPGDIVVSDQPRVLAHYLPATEVRPLRQGDTTPLMQSVSMLQTAGRGGALWLVVPYSSPGGFRTGPKLGTLKRWIYDNCQLRTTFGVARLDFRQNELQIYRCPAGTLRDPEANSE